MEESGDILDQIPDGPAATLFQSVRFEIISQPQTADNKITELKIPIMAITTKSSISEKPFCFLNLDFISLSE